MKIIKNYFNKILYHLFVVVKKREKYFQAKYAQEEILKNIGHKGENVKINGKIKILNPSGLYLGNNVHIGDNAHFDCRAGIVIGDHTHLSRNLTIYSTNHFYEGNLIPYDNRLIPGSVTIGKGVWIGMNVSILSGVTIGDGAIIAMGAIVTKNVQEGEIVASSSQKIIGSRNMPDCDYKLNNADVGGASGKPFDFLNKNLYSLISENEYHQDIIFLISLPNKYISSIVECLNDSKQIKAVEIFTQQLNLIAFNYRKELKDKEATKSALKSLFSSIDMAENNKPFVIFHSQFIALLTILKDIFPHAKYLWIIQPPSSFYLDALEYKYFKENQNLIFKNSIVIENRELDNSQLVIENKTDSEVEENKIISNWLNWNKQTEKVFKNLNTENKFLFKIEENNLSLDPVLEFLNLSNENDFMFKIKSIENIDDYQKNLVDKDVSKSLLFYEKLKL